MDTASLYREEILDHYQNPHNFGKIEGADTHARQTNPLCGDDIEMFIKFSNGLSRGVKLEHPGGVISEITFKGKGCAICMAAASMLTDYAKGRLKRELTKFSEKDMLKLLGIEVSETRKKCALLALSVLRDCLELT